jgi:hypothetical protein
MKMKKMFLLVALFLTFAVTVTAQDFGPEEGAHKRRPPMEKIEQLEKIKLLDVLNLDEAASAKLFTRRNQNRTRIWDNEKKIDKVLGDIEFEIKKGKDKDVSKIQKLNEDYCNLSIEVDKEKLSFIRSLSDILTPEQIGKYIVFERKFREEIRDLLMKERIRRNRGK